MKKYHRIDNALSVIFVYLSGLQEKSGEDRDHFIDLHLPAVRSALSDVRREVELIRCGSKGEVDDALSVLSSFLSRLGERRGVERDGLIASDLGLVRAAAADAEKKIDVLRIGSRGEEVR